MGNLQALKAKVEAHFEDKGYKESVCKRYRHTWANLEAFMRRKKYEDYTRDVGDEFLDDCHRGETYVNLSNRQKERYRHIDVLSDILTYGNVRRHVYTNKTYEYEGELGKPFRDFIEEYRGIRAASTICRYEERIMTLYQFLEKNKLSLMDFGHKEAIVFLKNLEDTKQDIDRDNTVMTIRVFLRHLCSRNLLSDNLPERWMSIFKLKYVRNKKIPSVYTQEEVEKVLSVIDRAHPQGKRDYAMALLAARCGLRASDIIGLRFCNIIWEENKISLIQTKTGKKVTLPLSEEVGSALIDYIKNGRPNLDHPCVFLTSHAPYKELSGNILAGNIAGWMQYAGIDSTGRKKGPHALRHSLATNLLGANTSMPVISEVLGHSSTESTLVYTRVNIDQLRRCALDVPFVPTSFYENLYG